MATDNHCRKCQEVFRRLKPLSFQQFAIAGIHIEKGPATTAKKNHSRKQEYEWSHQDFPKEPKKRRTGDNRENKEQAAKIRLRILCSLCFLLFDPGQLGFPKRYPAPR